MRAPVIVVAAAKLAKGHRIPEVEQLLSAGAAVQNIMLAAKARGFGAMWKTGAPAYDASVKQALGVAADSEIVGFLYLGTQVGGGISGAASGAEGSRVGVGWVAYCLTTPSPLEGA